MNRRRPLTLAGAAAIPLAALAVAGCGSGGGNATAASTHAKPAAQPKTATVARPAAVKISGSSLGKILVDSHGRTLYLFTKDSGTKSACTGACATAWPPVVASGKPTAGSGAKTSLVAAKKRSDGMTQVTYNGHPLYRFVKDAMAGDVNGQGVTAFGGQWFVLTAAGNQLAPAPVQAAPKPQPKPQPAAPKPQPKPQPAAPKAQPAPPSNGIPQSNGGDGDSDNNGGPDDGDGGV